jgi:hypothetical protein
VAEPMVPVGFYCDHSDDPPGERVHDRWEYVDGEGWTLQEDSTVVKALTLPGDRRGREQVTPRCLRAVPVYAVDAPALAAELDDLRAQNAKTEDNFTSYAETVAMELARLRGMNSRLHTALEQVRLLAVQPDLLRLIEKALGEGPAGPAAYVNGDNGTTLCCIACDGHIAHIDPGDDFDRLDAERRAHVCESGGKP